jgi:hypothetical protein
MRGVAALLCVLGTALAAPVARAQQLEPPTSEEVDERFAPGEQLSGREIYERFLHNRFRTMAQHLTVVSTNPRGDAQELQLLVRWKDFRDAADRPQRGVMSKTVVRFIEPFDLRRLTYLIVGREDGVHDQFYYSRGTRKVRRIQVRGLGIFGTDFTIDDLAFQTIEDGIYERLPDSQVGGRPVYVVRATLNPGFTTRYSVVTASIDKQRYVLLRALYEDGAGVLLREANAQVESIREFDGVWVATVSSMRNVKEDTLSTMVIQSLDPNPDLPDRLFSERSLGDTHWD